MNTELTQEHLKSILHYDGFSGEFYWINSRGSTRSKRLPCGARLAGCSTPDGYRMIRVGSAGYYAHRLAWLYMTAHWPKMFLDHINGARDDNRFENLRECTTQQNSANRSTDRGSHSGFKGVYWYSSHKKWAARISWSGKRRHLGYFRTAEEAAIAYDQEAKKLHGEFVRLNNPQPK